MSVSSSRFRSAVPASGHGSTASPALSLSLPRTIAEVFARRRHRPRSGAPGHAVGPLRMPNSTASRNGPRTRWRRSACGAVTASAAPCRTSPTSSSRSTARCGSVPCGWAQPRARAAREAVPAHRQRDVAAAVRRADRRATPRRRRRPGCRHRSRRGGGVWEDAMVAADDAPIDVEVDPFAPAGIAYTSGTTGYPKGAVHSQYNLLMPGAVLVASRGYGPELPPGRLPTAHHPQHAGAHHADDGPGRRVLGDHGPHRRARRGRVDPRGAGHRVERAARGDPLDGEHGRDRAERPRLAHRGVGRRCRLSRDDPHRVPGEVRDAAAHAPTD